MCTPELVSVRRVHRRLQVAVVAGARRPQRAGTWSPKPVRVKPGPDLVFEASRSETSAWEEAVMPSIASLLFSASLCLDIVAIQVCRKDVWRLFQEFYLPPLMFKSLLEFHASYKEISHIVVWYTNETCICAWYTKQWASWRHEAKSQQANLNFESGVFHLQWRLEKVSILSQQIQVKKKNSCVYCRRNPGAEA